AYLDYSQLNTKRFKPFHQLDLRVDKNYYFKNWTLMFYLDVQNVYNFKSNSQDVILREKNTDGSFKTINNGQNYVLKSYPNDSGTILPTLGVMVKF
ncbi:MAG: TonB-dependent receptor, partial [Bacilli bacterium]